MDMAVGSKRANGWSGGVALGLCGLSELLRAFDWVLRGHSTNLLCLSIMLSFHALFFFCCVFVDSAVV